MPHPPADPDFDAVVAEAGALQAHLPWLDLVCVGGTAAALHAGHRYSTDSDHVGVDVARHFGAVREALGAWAGWRTRRVRSPVAILGDRNGVQLGVRQQRREAPLDTTWVSGVRVPTAEETLRIKAWMVADRGATRDFVDVAALADLLGAERSAAALGPLSALYAPVGTETAAMRFAQAAVRAPVDAGEVDLRAYRGLRAPYDETAYVRLRVRDTAVAALERELAPPGPGDAGA